MISTLGIIGEPGTGKDSLADNLIKEHRQSQRVGTNLTHMKFARPLQSFLAEVVGNIEYSQKEGINFDFDMGSEVAQNWVDSVSAVAGKDFTWSYQQLLNILDKKFERKYDYVYVAHWRDMLKAIGTEWGRNIMGPDIWVDHVGEAIQFDTVSSPHWIVNHGYVISDARFANEVGFVDYCVGVVREDRPRFYYDGSHESEHINQSLNIAATNLMVMGSDILIEMFRDNVEYWGSKFLGVLVSRKDTMGKIYFEEVWWNNEFRSIRLS